MSKKEFNRLSDFPKNKLGKIIDYNNESLTMPNKIIEMGLLPDTIFKILYQAPFNGPLYVEFGVEQSKLALRKEEARFINVQEVE